MDWGNLLYMLFSGNLVDEPLKKLPSEADFPKQLAKLIQKSFNRPAESVASQLDSYLKKRDSTSQLDQLFKRSGSAQKESDSSPAPLSAASDRASQTEGSSLVQQRLEQERQAREEQERQEREEAERRRREEEAARREQERQAREKQERQEREEAER